MGLIVTYLTGKQVMGPFGMGPSVTVSARLNAAMGRMTIGAIERPVFAGAVSDELDSSGVT